jgi:hypothetical protein
VDDGMQAMPKVSPSRAFTPWVVGSFAIGIAATVAGLGFLNAALFLPFPAVDHQHRLVRIS